MKTAIIWYGFLKEYFDDNYKNDLWDIMKKRNKLLSSLLIFLFLITQIVVGVSASDPTGINTKFIYTSSSSDSLYEVKATNDNNILFFNHNDGTVPWTQNVGREIKALAISSDGNYIVVNCEGGLLILFNKNGDRLWKKTFPAVSIKSIEISNDDQFIDLMTVNNQALYITMKGIQVDGTLRYGGLSTPEPTLTPTVIPTTLPTSISTPITTISPSTPTTISITKSQAKTQEPFSFSSILLVGIVLGLIALYAISTNQKKNRRTVTCSSPLTPENKLISQKLPQKTGISGTSKVTSIPESNPGLPKRPAPTEKPFLNIPEIKPKVEKKSEIPHSLPQPPFRVFDPTPAPTGELIPRQEKAKSASVAKITFEFKPGNTIDESFSDDETDEETKPKISKNTQVSIKRKLVKITGHEPHSTSSQIPSEKLPQPEITGENRVSPSSSPRYKIIETVNLAKEKFEKGIDLFKLGKYPEALFAFDRAIELKPDYANAWNIRGIILNKLGNPADALSSYEKAIDLNPEYADAYFNRGEALNKLGKYDEAIASYDKAVTLNPEYTEAYFSYGVLQNTLGKYADAVASFDKCVEIKPDYAVVWYKRGIALNNLSQYPESLSSFNKAIAIDPKFSEVYSIRGNVQNALGQYADAVASFDKILESKPTDAEVWYNRGIALNNLGQRSESLTSYDEAIAINPDYITAYFNRGNLQNSLEKYVEAVASFDTILTIKPNDAVVWYHRGNSLSNLGQYSEALSSFDKAIALKPEYPLAQKSREDVLLKIHSKTKPVALSDPRKENYNQWNISPGEEILKPELEETSPVFPQQPRTCKGSLLRLDQKKLEKVKHETQKTQELLGKIFETEDDTDSLSLSDSIIAQSVNVSEAERLQENYNLPFPPDCLKSLDSKYYPLLAKIVNRTDISKEEFKKIVRESHLMYEATITEINTWAEDNLEDFLLEDEPDEDRIKININ